MALHLTLEKAQSMVEQAIADNGADYVYRKANTGGCTYVDIEYVDGEFPMEEKVYSKGCIVGHAFISELNLDMARIGFNNVNVEGSDNFVVWLREEGHIEQIDADALRYLNLLQRSQDAGRPWGEAHEQAKLGKTWDSARDDYITPVMY